jgi:hypothetical protein
VEAGACEFKASLSYIVRPCVQNKKLNEKIILKRKKTV